MIGAYRGNGGTGEVYVVFGPLQAGVLDLASGADVIFKGIDGGDQAGYDVGCGDVTDDGVHDLVIGANRADPGDKFDAGESYIVSGPLTSGTFDLASVADVTFEGIQGMDDFDHADWSGSAVAAGDVNGDGVGDVVIGARARNPMSDGGTAGETYVMFGPILGGTYALSDADVTIRGDQQNENSGSGTAVGDVDGDGVMDLVIGARAADPPNRVGAGMTYGFSGPVQPGKNTLGAIASMVYNGPGFSDNTGWDVAVGDINGDGGDDLLVTARPARSLCGARRTATPSIGSQPLGTWAVRAGDGSHRCHRLATPAQF